MTDTDTFHYLLVPSFADETLDRYDIEVRPILKSIKNHFGTIASAMVLIEGNMVLVAGRKVGTFGKRPATHFIWDGTELTYHGHAVIRIKEREVAWKLTREKHHNKIYQT